MSHRRQPLFESLRNVTPGKSPVKIVTRLAKALQGINSYQSYPQPWEDEVERRLHRGNLTTSRISRACQLLQAIGEQLVPMRLDIQKPKMVWHAQ